MGATYQERRARHHRHKSAKEVREDQLAWKSLLKRWDIDPATTRKPKDFKADSPQLQSMGNSLAMERIKASRQIPSVQSTTHDCSPPPTATYTGDQMLGVATLHKSNAVPVFQAQDARDIAKMRRG